MAKIEIRKKPPIHYLVKDKFPEVRTDFDEDSIMTERHPTQNAADSYQKELMSLSDKDLSLRYKKYLQKTIELKNKRTIIQNARKEQELHKLYTYWFKVPMWEIGEATKLFCGLDPNSKVDTFNEEHHEMQMLALRCYKYDFNSTSILPTKFIQWAESKGYTPNEVLSQYIPKKSESDKVSNMPEERLLLKNSAYLNDFITKLEVAVKEFPTWKLTQRKIQKTGNLQDWLVETVGFDNREAEVAKKVLSESFEDLN